MSYHLFQVFGVEIEYAVVRGDTLAVTPDVDRLLTALGGGPDAHPSLGGVEADNELAAHVLEMKLRRPLPGLAAQVADFAGFVKLLNRTLGEWGARLMPGGMHPFMDPARESRLWPHEDSAIYRTFDRVFGCRGHGWFNIQSVHLNLPFCGDEEFSQLHNGISLVLPLLPALAAASPIFEGRAQGWLDSRLFHYVANQRKLPAIIGGIVPEPVGSESEYRERILAPMYKQIAPLDPEGTLQDEWLNSRAAIARFDREAIEIRCLDTQEAPLADLALCHLAVALVKRLMALNPDLHSVHRRIPEGLLKALFLASAEKGRAAPLPPEFPARAFGMDPGPATVGAFLQALWEEVRKDDASPENALFGPVIGHILSQGSLAERILRAAPKPEGYPGVYLALCGCLDTGTLFNPGTLFDPGGRILAA